MTDQQTSRIIAAQDALDQAIEQHKLAEAAWREAKSASSAAVAQPAPCDAAGMALRRLELQNVADKVQEANSQLLAAQRCERESRGKLESEWSIARRALATIQTARNAVLNWTKQVATFQHECEVARSLNGSDHVYRPRLSHAEQELAAAQARLSEGRANAEALGFILEPEAPVELLELPEVNPRQYPLPVTIRSSATRLGGIAYFDREGKEVTREGAPMLEG